MGKCRSHTNVFWVYGTMVSGERNIPEKSKERFHTFNPKGDQALSSIERLMIAIESLRENRSHAVCKSRKLFDMERFHDFLVGFLVVYGTRKHRQLWR